MEENKNIETSIETNEDQEFQEEEFVEAVGDTEEVYEEKEEEVE